MNNKIIIPSGFKITSAVPTDDRSIRTTRDELFNNLFIMSCPVGFLVTVTTDEKKKNNGVYRRVAEDPYWIKISDDITGDGAIGNFRYYDNKAYYPNKIHTDEYSEISSTETEAYITCELTEFNSGYSIDITGLYNSDMLVVPYKNPIADESDAFIKRVFIYMNTDYDKIIIPNTVTHVYIEYGDDITTDHNIGELHIPSSVTELVINCNFTGKLYITNPNTSLSSFQSLFKTGFTAYIPSTSPLANYCKVHNIPYIYTDVEYYYNFTVEANNILNVCSDNIVVIDGKYYMLPILVESYDEELNAITLSSDGSGRYLLLRNPDGTFILKDLETATDITGGDSTIDGIIDLGDLSKYAISYYSANPLSTDAPVYGYVNGEDSIALDTYTTIWRQTII